MTTNADITNYANFAHIWMSGNPPLVFLCESLLFIFLPKETALVFLSGKLFYY